ncbi:MAG TPA: EamA family transporter, partial [Thermodesulfobium narugense]|nr:EamA family transporter [Thermodesulfobium narugense]
AVRLFCAALILLSIILVKKINLRLNFYEFKVIFSTSLLMWVFGNGLIMWAEQNAASGLTALILGVTPILASFLDSIFTKRMPSLISILSLLLGFVGVFCLFIPKISNFSFIGIFSYFLVFISALCWACGAIIQRNYSLNMSVLTISFYQNIFASLGFFLLSQFFHESYTLPGLNAILACAYLVLFGSVLAFTAYINAVKLLPINISMTYAYVNPVLALFLGHVILNEEINSYTIIGAILIILGILGVFKDQISNKK